ncbi:putative nucleotidyltransferase substrate binding domain-containing protein [Pelagibius sp.]|uniref:putative nucleotidyltransferase substrate binding domain-containing protein n=1 Tax=Pelagibius sp. TaxID=1931238 RepID=UPI0026306733|nr:putative nucleotidyltransferase substrate binding domain-containing protein [Pelagibius sp.]
MSFQGAETSLSGLPLRAIPAVVLDTETTGLDVVHDHVIEIGGVRLSGGRIAEGDSHSVLVNPGMPIPGDSTAIHGITDADVSGAPAFREAMDGFVDWAGPSVVIGYSIGFDLAILKAEHERNGLDWQMPRSLDVRHLLHLVGANLPSQSLETVAGWLGLETSNRHRALGDAILTAEIFLALVPKLAEAGVTTLAQAERACRALTERLDEEARAGWQGFDQLGQAVAPSVAEYARVDSFPYRHKVADLMNSPPLTIAGDAPLQEALGVMAGKKVSSLFLPARADAAAAEDGWGIITERDVLRAVDALGGAALQWPVAEFAARPLVTIKADEFVYRALARMSGGGFRHLGVVDAEGALVGALSARDLLRQRASDAVSLGDCIEQAETAAELGRIWADLTVVARALVHEDVDSRDVAAIVSRELRALTRRACEFAEAELEASEMGPAPLPYAMMVLGSGGRGESLLAMDQDNAVVFAGDAAGSAAELNGRDVDPWFAALGQRTADILNDAGVCYCKGGVMAANAEWRMDLAGWRDTVGTWITRSKPEDMLNCDIFFDAVPVHGAAELAERLHDEALEAAKGSRSFLRLLALKAGQLEAPVGWFGRLKLDHGRVDLKKGGIMPIFSAARVIALQHGIAKRSTPERLEAARGLDLVPARTIDNLIEAHRILLDLILRQQLRDIDQGLPLSNRVAPGELTAFQRQEMRWALDQVPAIADLLGIPAFA